MAVEAEYGSDVGVGPEVRAFDLPTAPHFGRRPARLATYRVEGGAGIEGDRFRLPRRLGPGRAEPEDRTRAERRPQPLRPHGTHPPPSPARAPHSALPQPRSPSNPLRSR